LERGGKLDWTKVKEQVRIFGMRNSNTMAIAPTATISNIVGCFPCIEPIYKNLYVKSNMSGEFTIVNKYLVADLKRLGLWNRDLLDQIKYLDGSIQMIETIPCVIKNKYKEAFELDTLHLIHMTARRGKWIDQSQSHNVFMKGVSGKLLNDIYVAAWKRGLKTTYYLRTLGASQIEKSTLDAKVFGFTQKREYGSLSNGSEAVTAPLNGLSVISREVYENASEIKNGSIYVNGSHGDDDTLLLKVTAACSLSTDPDCEVCQ
jgi:ribonucleoside-diphosphate reductase alpha chain